MNNVYYKNYAIWLGGAMALDWVLGFAGGFDFLFNLIGPMVQYVGWIFIIAGTIAGTVVAHKELGKNIEFGKAVLPVIIIIAGFGLINFVVLVARFGIDDVGSFFFYYKEDVILQILIGISILLAVGTWYMFEKAGKPGWAMLVPIYNIIVWCEIAKKPGWWVLLLLIPIVNIIILIMILNGISKNFGKDAGFTVGLVFLRQIFFAILGYGDAVYLASEPKMNDQVIDDYRRSER